MNAGETVVTHAQYELLSNQAVAACAVVYFLAVLAHLAEWAAGRKVEVPVAETVVRRWRRLGGRRRPRSPSRSPSGCSSTAASASP